MSGQPFLPSLLDWHPRDVATLLEHYEDLASEARLDAARAKAKQWMG